jgi:DNA helicase-2/ATP-dependent DNA helicase PcrA
VQKSKSDIDKYKIGQKIKHARFGIGRIINIEGAGDNKFANIAFDGLGIKKFSLALTPMEIVE